MAISRELEEQLKKAKDKSRERLIGSLNNIYNNKINYG